LFAGRRFRVSYDGLAADNVYSADGRHVQYAIVSGAYAGAQGEAACEWQRISDGVYAISWQEADGATVVHVDDFAAGIRWPGSPPPMAVSIACRAAAAL
jgi:phenolic acid decarboxylase